MSLLLQVIAAAVTDWLVQHPDPLPAPPRTSAIAASGAVQAPNEPITPESIEAWSVQPPDPRRRPPELVPEGQLSFLRLVTLSETPIDWLVQHPDPRRRPPELVPEGLVAFTRLVELSETPIDWLVQHPNPVPPPVAAPAGGIFFVEDFAAPPAPPAVQESPQVLGPRVIIIPPRVVSY